MLAELTPSGGSEGECIPSFQWSSAVLGAPCLWWLHSSLGLCLPTASSLWASDSVSSLQKNNSLTGFRPTLLQYYLTLTNYICKELFQTKLHSVVSEGHEFSGDAVQPSASWIPALLTSFRPPPLVLSLNFFPFRLYGNSESPA